MAFQPDPLGPVLALLDAVVYPGAELPSPPELVAPMGDVNLRVVRPVDTSEVTVPAGPATRFRTPFAPYPGNGGGIRFPVAGAVGYGIRPPGLPGFVLLSGRWFHAGLGDVLAGQIDELAGRLEIAFNQ